jgi:hypothetical protein
MDGSSLLTWQLNGGAASGALLAQGDADANGTIDDSDLSGWESQDGTTPLITVAAAPEPTAA